VHALPVKAVLPTAPAMAIRSRSAASCSTVSATAELSNPIAWAARQGHGDSVHASPAEIAIVDNVANTDDRQCQFSGIHL
jgi:hypothetical protein